MRLGDTSGSYKLRVIEILQSYLNEIACISASAALNALACFSVPCF